MGSKTGIEWTDATWNPIRGCSRVSEGCRNCYAEAVAYRFSGKRQPYEGLAVLKNGHASWTGKVEFIEKHLLDPLKWKPGRPIYDAAVVDLDGKPKRVGRDAGQSLRIFVNSMSDLFHENVTDEQRDKIFAVMALCPQHTFQILTKRPERMLAYLKRDRSDYWFSAAMEYPRHPMGFSDCCVSPLPNVWLGVSVENQKTADERIPLLLQTPAAVRFISAEPLLGPIDLEGDDNDGPLFDGHPTAEQMSFENPRGDRYVRYGTPRIDWVICGGESGPGARPMHPDWARSLRDQCAAAGVPFFFKQWGEWGPLDQNRGLGWNLGDPRTGYWAQDAPGLYEWHHMGVASHGEHMLMVGKKAAGAMLDGVEHKAFPAVR